MDKIDQQIIESIISIVDPIVEDDNQLVREYLEGYFGNELNESTTDEDVMEAFNELLETADAVEEFIAEISNERIANAAMDQVHASSMSSRRDPKPGQVQRVMRKLAKRGGQEHIKRYNSAVRGNAPNYDARGNER